MNIDLTSSGRTKICHETTFQRYIFEQGNRKIHHHQNKLSNKPDLLGMPVFYFPLGNLLEGNYTFKESALTNRAVNLSKNNIQLLDFQNVQKNPVEASGCWPTASCSGRFHNTGDDYS